MKPLFRILSLPAFLAALLLFSGCEKKTEDNRAILRINSTPKGASVILLDKEQGGGL